MPRRSDSLATQIYQKLALAYPNAKCELLHENCFQLLIATILSAQCTDIRVNQVTPQLFATFPDVASLAQAPIASLEEIIRSTGFFRSKAKNIRQCAQKIMALYQGEVPATMEALTALPGVGRKTANVVLGNCFHQNVGIVVDTHVKRLAHRLGLTAHRDPEKIEQDLMPLFAPTQWTQLSHLLIFHGRRQCAARKPQCSTCPLQECCRFYLLSTKCEENVSNVSEDENYLLRSH